MKTNEEIFKEFKKEFWSVHADGGVTPSTTDHPPEGWDEWKSDPTEVWEWLGYKLRDIITAKDAEIAEAYKRGYIESGLSMPFTPPSK